MAKKFLSILILISMTLHCCGRLGVISYLYANRSDIAYSLGMMAEKAISVCKSDHFQQSQLNLQPEKEKQFPFESVQAQEINLYCPPSVVVISSPVQSIDKTVTRLIPKEYPSPYSDIFHPPGLLS